MPERNAIETSPRPLACELYQAWEAARDEASAALRHWRAAAVDDRRDAYTTYRAAADREDAAAECFLRSES